MYADRVSHGEYAPRALLTLEKLEQTDGRTDARPMYYANS